MKSITSFSFFIFFSIYWKFYQIDGFTKALDFFINPFGQKEIFHLKIVQILALPNGGNIVID